MITTKSLIVSAVIGDADHIFCSTVRETPIGKRGLNRFGIPRYLRTLTRHATRTVAERCVSRLRDKVRLDSVTTITELLECVEES